MRRTRTPLPGLAALTAVLGLTLALAACGGDAAGNDGPGGTPAPEPGVEVTVTGPRNGVESRPAAEIISTAAEALRAATTVRYVGRGSDSGRAPAIDLRLGADGTVLGVLDGDGQRVEVLRIANIAYVRGPNATASYPGARADQWINTGTVGTSDSLSLSSAVDEILNMKERIDAGEKATVDRAVALGTPAVRVTMESATLYVSNIGPAVPLRQITGQDDDRLDVTFTEYGKPIVATVPTDTFMPQTTATS